MLQRIVFTAAALCLVGSSPAWSQVVQFRLETTDMAGTPVDTVTIGEEYMLKTYTQHVNGYVSEENSGVFAAYLDISYDAGLTSVAGDVLFEDQYAWVTSGDMSTPGLMDNIGGLGLNFPDLTPIGLDEKLVFSVPMTADAEGFVNFVGADSQSDVQHPVLVYGLNDTVAAKDIDFGSAGTRLAFDTVGLMVVPEPQSAIPLLFGALALLHAIRRRN